MGDITLERIHEDMMSLKEEMGKIRAIVEEDHEVADDVFTDMQKSRARDKSELVSHEDMGKEFS